MAVNENPQVVVEVVGAGPHYVWNDDQTGLVAKDGPIDGSKPFFVVPPIEEHSPEVHSAGWPTGWVEIGATED